MKKLVNILIIVLLFSCNSENAGDCFQSTGTIIQQEMTVFGFDKILVNRDIELIIKDGLVQKLVIETGKNLLNDVEAVVVPDVTVELKYVMDAIKMTKQMLNDDIPLIGFAGSPWTILCYCVQGQGSKTFDLAKEFCFTKPELAHTLLQKITDTTIAYLKEKVKAGVNAVQIFDSWGGMLSPVDYQEFSWKYINQIIEALKDEAPVIAFGKGCWFALEDMAKSNAAALGVDWTITPQMARKFAGDKITLQGNFDPSRLLSPPTEIKKMVTKMINDFGKDKYIVNLGHGILPNIPLDNAKAFIDAVKEYR